MLSNNTPRILIIAGSDSGGGAGIQGDIKTINSLGGYAATAITALTVQNTLGVSDILKISPEFVIKQALAVIEDIGVDVIKTGMLADIEILQAVADLIAKYQIKAVIDPVMFAKGGAALLEKQAMQALQEHLIPKAYIITPNIPEAEAICGFAIHSKQDMQKAAKAILQMGAKNIYLKGGHLEGNDLCDIIDGEEYYEINYSRINSKHTHGTGCSLASALATHIGFGYPLRDAAQKSHAYIQHIIKHAPKFGGGNGPLGHMKTYSG